MDSGCCAQSIHYNGQVLKSVLKHQASTSEQARTHILAVWPISESKDGIERGVSSAVPFISFSPGQRDGTRQNGMINPGLSSTAMRVFMSWLHAIWGPVSNYRPGV